MGGLLIIAGILIVSLSILVSRDIQNALHYAFKESGHTSFTQVHNSCKTKLGYCALSTFSGIALISIGLYMSFSQ